MAAGRVNIFYDDTEKVSCKTGKIIKEEDDDKFLTVETNYGIIKIPIHRIVRIEVLR